MKKLAIEVEVYTVSDLLIEVMTDYEWHQHENCYWKELWDDGYGNGMRLPYEVVEFDSAENEDMKLLEEVDNEELTEAYEEAVEQRKRS